MIDEGVVKIFTTKQCVTICRFHLKIRKEHGRLVKNGRRAYRLNEWILKPLFFPYPFVSFAHLKDALLNFEDGHVEGSSSEIVDGDDFVLGFIEAVSQGRRRRLIDHAKHVQTRDLALLTK